MLKSGVMKTKRIELPTRKALALNVVLLSTVACSGTESPQQGADTGSGFDTSIDTSIDTNVDTGADTLLAERPDATDRDEGVDPPDIVEVAHGPEVRSVNTTCLGWERPQMGSSIALERAFSNLTFTQPVWMQQAPGAPGRWYVIELDPDRG